MSTDRWPEVKELLSQALELDPAERSSFLAGQCPDDEIRAEVELYLEDESDVATFIERPIVDLLADLPAEDRTGQRVGAYRLEERIGEGGMSVIYRASRVDEAFEQEVAVKVVKRGLDTDAVVRRFRRERQILANLDDPRIARILDGGSTTDDVPYFVMELVDGVPVDRYCADRGLSLEEVLALFRQVCETVHFAHQNLVVHCDLKPANILITSGGEPRLVDFGIAKLLRPEDSGETRTLLHWRLGTPAYASPEQELGGKITTASDVYSLGALLYRLLTGRRPYPEDGRSVPDPARKLTPPPKPSSRMDAAPSAKEWLPRVRGDLDTIVRKAMDAEPAGRYGSVAELAEDVRRHLDKLPISARPNKLTYRIGRFVRRHPLGVVLGTAAAAMTMIFVTLLYAQLQETQAQRDRAYVLRDAFLGLASSIDLTGEGVGSEVTSGALDQVIDHPLSPDPVERAMLLDRLGRLYYRSGFLSEARQLFEKSLALRRNLPDADPANVASSLNNLALVQIELGETQQSLDMLREAMTLLDESSPEDPEKSLSVLNNVAMALEKKGRYAETEALYREVLEHKRRLFGDRSPQVATGLNNLAAALIRQGRFEEAGPLMEQALELREDLEGPDHARIATELINLGALSDAQGKYRDAIRHYRRALAIRRQHFTEDHPAVARAIAALAFSLLGSGAPDELDEAEVLLRRALEIYRSRHGISDPTTLVFQRNLAATLLAKGDPVAAEGLAREVLRLSLSVLPADHWRIADARSVLGHCLLAQGRYEEAERLVVDSYPVIRDVKGESSRYAREALARIGILRQGHSQN